MPDSPDLRQAIAERMARAAGSKAFDEPGPAWDHARSAWLRQASAALAAIQEQYVPPPLARAVRQLARHGRTPTAVTAVPLAELTPGDLVHVATTHPDGPQPEHREEAERRIREAPPFTAMALALTFARLRSQSTGRRKAGQP